MKKEGSEREEERVRDGKRDKEKKGKGDIVRERV